MSGVTRLILDSELGSARGDDDFFSVARTIPLVAFEGLAWVEEGGASRLAFDTEGGDTLVDGVQSIF